MLTNLGTDMNVKNLGAAFSCSAICRAFACSLPPPFFTSLFRHLFVPAQNYSSHSLQPT